MSFLIYVFIWGVAIIIIISIFSSNTAKKSIDSEEIDDTDINKQEDYNEKVKRLYSLVQKDSIATIEFPRRKQILEESIELLISSNDLSLLLFRYDEAMSQYLWIMQQIEKGVPIWFKTEEEGFESALNRVFNYSLERLIDHFYTLYRESMTTSKIIEVKENSTIRMFELIEKCTSYLKEHQNKSEVKSYLNEIHNKVEDIYSNIDKG